MREKHLKEKKKGTDPNLPINTPGVERFGLTTGPDQENIFFLDLVTSSKKFINHQHDLWQFEVVSTAHRGPDLFPVQTA